MDFEDRFQDVPHDELAVFEKYIHTGHAGDKFMHEDEPNNQTLYLLRSGKVGIYRRVGKEKKLIATIEAISFFGEMEIIVGGDRMATVEALSEDVMVYAFKNPDLHTIITNPNWGEKMVVRLCADLKIFADRIASHEAENMALKAKLDIANLQMAILLSAINELQVKVASEVVLGTNDWLYLVGIRELVLNFARRKLPDVYPLMDGIHESMIKELKREGLVPKKLLDLFPKLIDDDPQG